MSRVAGSSEREAPPARLAARRSRRLLVVSAPGWGLALALLTCSAPCAGEFVAAQFTDEADAVPGDGICRTSTGGCSLRAAVQEANRNPGLDTIVLADGVHPVTIDPVDDDTDEATGNLNVTDDLIVRGSGPEACTIEGDHGSGFFESLAHDLEIEGCHLTRGLGEGVRVGRERLVVRNCRVTEHLADDQGPGACGIRSGGDLEIEDSVFSGNECFAVVLDREGFVPYRDVAMSLRLRRSRFENGGGGLLNLDALPQGDYLITDNVFVDLDYFGIHIPYSSGRLHVERCRFERTRGLSVPQSTDLLVADCHFVDGHLRGLFLGTFEASGELVRIERCSFVGHPAEAILTGFGLTFIRNCTFVGNGQAVKVPWTFGRPPELDAVYLRSNTIVGSGPPGSEVLPAVDTPRVPEPLVTVSNTLFHDTGPEGDWSGHLVSGGHNIFEDPSGRYESELHPTDRVLVNPGLLEPIADDVHGSRVPLAPGSAALDTGDPAGCDDGESRLLTTDQARAPRHLDGDGDGLVRCDVGAVEHCGPDRDGDGHGDDCDCAPDDPNAWAGAPQVLLGAFEVPGTDDVLVRWTDVTAPGVVVTEYEVTRGLISDLLLEGAALGSCVARPVSPIWGDPSPPPGGVWYLVRGIASCSGPGQGWGRDSLGVARPGCP